MKKQAYYSAYRVYTPEQKEAFHNDKDFTLSQEQNEEIEYIKLVRNLENVSFLDERQQEQYDNNERITLSDLQIKRYYDKVNKDKYIIARNALSRKIETLILAGREHKAFSSLLKEVNDTANYFINGSN